MVYAVVNGEVMLISTDGKTDRAKLADAQAIHREVCMHGALHAS